MPGNNELTKNRPWEDKDNTRQGYPFSLRLTAAQKAKLDFVVANSPDARSAHSLILSILLPAIDEVAENLYLSANSGARLVQKNGQLTLPETYT